MAQIHSINVGVSLTGPSSPAPSGISLLSLQHGPGKVTARKTRRQKPEVVPTVREHKDKLHQQTRRRIVSLRLSLHDLEAHRHLTFHQSPVFKDKQDTPTITAGPTETSGFESLSLGAKAVW